MSADNETQSPETSGQSKRDDPRNKWSSNGPLSALYNNKYKHVFLQFPSNIEAAEESHWVQFDIKSLMGKPLREDKSRDLYNAPKKGEENFLDRVVASTSEKASAIATSALLAPLNAVKSTVNEFVNDLPPGLGNLGKDLLGLQREQIRGLGSIVLYAPHIRQDSLRLVWNQHDISNTGKAFEGAGASVPRSLKNLFSGNSETLKQLYANKGIIFDAALAKIAGSAVSNENLQRINLRSKGLAYNNHLELFFQNVDFRTYTFDFKLAPRNSADARTIRDIIQLLKFSAAPELLGGEYGFFFAYPNVFDIQFFNEEQTHRIATSALTGINVDHAGSGYNSTFYDDFPIETNLSLTFTELDIVHKSKIDAGY